ncbi:MAG: hypothetical protein JNJ63_11110 [Hyphomonadaceae bacterium]|nr:hypothetical protein [Hyphomonadaceae bacterium]
MKWCDGSPARIVAPDPHYFALQKLWRGRQSKRNPLKRAKDIKQGEALLEAVAEAMPHFPLEGDFAANLPEALAPLFADWRALQALDFALCSARRRPGRWSGRAPRPDASSSAARSRAGQGPKRPCTRARAGGI